MFVNRCSRLSLIQARISSGISSIIFQLLIRKSDVEWEGENKMQDEANEICFHDVERLILDGNVSRWECIDCGHKSIGM